MRRGTLTPLASLISIPSSCDHARVLENSRRSKQISLSLSFGDTSTKRNRSIDRYIDISGGRIEISGKDRDGKLAVRELNGFSPVYILLSLFLSPLAGFSLRFNDRLTESLCFFLFLSLSIEISRFISLLARFGKSGISIEIELVRSPSYLDEVERGWKERRSRAERERSRDSLSLFFPLSSKTCTSPTSYLLP